MKKQNYIDESDNSLISVDITEEMTCEEIFDRVLAFIREPYDGQVSDVIFMDEANEKTEEICNELGIEFIPAN